MKISNSHSTSARMLPVGRPAGYLPTLDGWRAVAVTMVCLAHSETFTGHFSELNFLHTYADFGVNIFFAISGILICSRLLDEEDRAGVISVKAFYIRRACRILPAAYLYLSTITALALARITPPDWRGLCSAVFLYRNYLPTPLGDTVFNRLTSHFWSLSIEEHFYLFFPFLLVAFPRRRKLMLSLLLAVSLAWLGIYLTSTPASMRAPTWERRSDLRLWCLLFPALLAVALRQGSVRSWFVRLVTPNLLYGAILAELIYRGMHLVRNHLHPAVQPAHTSGFIDTSFQPFYFLALPLSLPFFVLATMLHPTALLSRCLEWRPLRAIGRISYGIYLWQQLFFGSSVEQGWAIGRLSDPLRGTIVVFAVLSSYFFVEKPLVRLGHRLAPPITPGHQDLEARSLPSNSK